MESAQYETLSRVVQARYPRGARNDSLGLLIVGTVIVMTGLALWVSSSASPWIWFLGQCWLALCVVQAFILVHDLGHGCFFKTRFLNDLFGNLVSAIVILPFYPWRYVHADHHIWVGWTEKDPTMSQITPRQLSPLLIRTVDFCWKWWIPVFSLTFSFGAFWNLPKIFMRRKSHAVRVRLVWSVVFLLLLYGVILTFWPLQFLKLYGVGYLMHLAIADPLLLSQHAHVPQKSTQGLDVLPLPYSEQDEFTRSLLFPRWISKWLLLYFDRHGMHHLFPSLPLYRLGMVQAPLKNQISAWTWLKAAKKLPVHRLLLESSRQTGVWI